MKRLGVISFLILAMMALLAPVASAHGGPGGPGGHDGGGHDGHHRDHHQRRHHHHGGGGGGGGGQLTVTYAAQAGDTAPGMDMVLHADVTVALTVTAVAHLPTGDISMPLTVTPGVAAFAADGTIGVGGEEPTGPVSIDFTFNYGGATTVVTVVAQIATTT